MRPPCPLPATAVAELEQLLRASQTKAEHQRVLCLWLRAALGLPAAAIATALGWHRSSVYDLHSRYLRWGAAALAGVGRGGRHRAHLSWEQERHLLAQFSSSASQGGVVEAGPVRAAYEALLGLAVAPSTVYRLLARHGWRKLVPRPRHRQTSAAAQQAFKKSFAAWCVPKPCAKPDAA